MADGNTDGDDSDLTPIRIDGAERRVVWQPFDLSISTLVEQIDDGQLVLESDVQRPYMWSNTRASRLIESLLLNVPIPVCYFSEDDDGHYEVIDGHQRLGSIHRFVKGEYSLSGLQALNELNQKRFRTLGNREQRTIGTRTIRCIVLTQESHPEVKFDVFERLNTGAVSLSAQELRNCIYRGPLNSLVKELATDANTLSILNRKSPAPRLRDQELVLRFLAFRADAMNYRPPLRQYLNEFAKANRYASPQEAGDLADAFHHALSNSAAALGSWAFRGAGRASANPERNVNAALYDTQMLNFALFPTETIRARRTDILREMHRLLEMPAFVDAIRGATADRARFLTRIRMLSERLAAIGLDNGLAEQVQEAEAREP